MSAFFIEGNPSGGVYFTSPLDSFAPDASTAAMGVLFFGSPMPRLMTASPRSRRRRASSFRAKVGDSAEFLSLAKKLEAFHSMGVREVMCFDVDAPEGTRLRAWDRVDGDLVERIVRGERTPCVTLGKWFHVARLGDLPSALAIADDEAGNGMVLTHAEANAALEVALARAEARARSAEARANVEATARELEAEARRAAEARIRELEEELRAKG